MEPMTEAQHLVADSGGVVGETLALTSASAARLIPMACAQDRAGRRSIGLAGAARLGHDGIALVTGEPQWM
ncbi:MAG: hypothetical protein BRD57_01530 [Proteobacteria bacterium SW_6_67_9]|nr:MAG: hypothetical protein BRD57_01530 [Proteobacteria bacterium SW_6_67_9]